MRRREFIKVVIGGGAATWSVAALAQQSAVPVIGFLHIASPGAYVHVVAAFRRGLMENNLQ
jgi:putative ABC transport system substrate-binding protein